MVVLSLVSCENQGLSRLFATTPTPDLHPFASMPANGGISLDILPESHSPVQPVQLGWFHNAPLDVSNHALLAQYFDLAIFTAGEEAQRDQVKAQGAHSLFLNYILFNAIRDEDPATCFEEPYPARADLQVGDYCMIRDQHPDWFLYTSAGNKIFSDYQGEIMDPANQGWRNFWLERVRSLEGRGWDGVLLDNVEASDEYLRKFSGNRLPASFSEANYIQAIEEFLKYLYSSYFQPRGRLVYANLIGVKDLRVLFRYLPYLDGIMWEKFAVDWEDGYLDVAEWEQQLYMARQVQAQGKAILLVSQGGQADLKRQEFAFASYLLINDGKAYFRYAYSGPSQRFPNTAAYAEIWLYKDYLLDLGQPLGSVYKQGDLWKRDFERGHVVVDPVNHQAAFGLDQP